MKETEPDYETTLLNKTFKVVKRNQDRERYTAKQSNHIFRGIFFVE